MIFLFFFAFLNDFHAHWPEPAAVAQVSLLVLDWFLTNNALLFSSGLCAFVVSRFLTSISTAVSFTGLQVGALPGSLGPSTSLHISRRCSGKVKSCEWNAALRVPIGLVCMQDPLLRTWCKYVVEEKQVPACFGARSEKTLQVDESLRTCGDFIPHLHPLTVLFFSPPTTTSRPSCHCVIRDERKLSQHVLN